MTEKQPKVSVIVALYKSAPFLVETVQELLQQTMPDFELLLIDDCSPDNTWELAQQLAKTDMRIRVDRLETNHGGPAAARSRGVELARGEFVTFLDHDDRFYPEKLAVMLPEMDRQKVDFLCCNVELLNHQTGQVDGTAWGEVTGDVRAGFARRLLHGNFVPSNSTLIRRSVLQQVGPFNEELGGVDDYEMWYRIARVAPCGVLNQVLASWRYRNQASISADDKKMIEGELKFYQSVANSGESWEQPLAVAGMRRCLLRLANRSLLAGNYREARKGYIAAGAYPMAGLMLLGGPVLRWLYRQKRERNAGQEFVPIKLDFGG